MLTVFITFILTVILVLGGLGLYIWKANPLNIQACLISGALHSVGDQNSSQDSNDKQTSDTDKHPLLNADQEKQLEEAGVNVESLPQEISPEAEKCFVDKLGEKRVEEIKNGASPTTFEIMKASSCF